MLRGFIDSTGVEWRVWEVQPSASGSRIDALSLTSLKASGFADGWLCFESSAEKRRLAPIPAGWATNDPVLLEQLCARATVVPSRHGVHRTSAA